MQDPDKIFIKVFDEYYQVIYKYVFLRTGRIKEVAEDLSQEIFIKAAKSFTKFDYKRASIKTWLFIIARNCIIDYYRKPKEINDSITEEIENSIYQNDKTDDKVLLDYLLIKLDLLKDQEKDVVIYKFFEGLSDKEISEIIKKNYEATRVFIYRTVNKLKDLINEKY